MKKILGLFVVLFVITTAWADKIVVENPLHPKVKTSELKLIDSFEMHEDFDMNNLFFINDDKIYTNSIMAKMGIISDLEGNLVNLIDALGSGPGELNMPNAIFDDVLNNRIGICDQMNRRVSYYNYMGDHIEDVLFDGMNVEQSISYAGDTKVRYFFKIVINQDKGTVMMEPTIEVYTGEGPVTIFSSIINPFQMSFSDGQMPWTATSDNYIYITTLNYDNYVIQVFNRDGSHKFDIEKDYKKVKRSEEDIAEIQDMLDEVKKQTKALGGIQEFDYSGFDYENGVNSMITDERGHLWVNTFDDKGSLFDIFDESGKIVSQARIKDHKFGQCQFYKGKLYEIAGDEDDGFTLNVYKVK